MVSKDGIGGDAWILAFNEAEQKLIDGANRKVVLSGSTVNISQPKNPHSFNYKKINQSGVRFPDDCRLYTAPSGKRTK